MTAKKIRTSRYRVFGVVYEVHNCNCKYCDHGYKSRQKINSEVVAFNEADARWQVSTSPDDELEAEYIGELGQDTIMRIQQWPTLPGMKVSA